MGPKMGQMARASFSNQLIIWEFDRYFQPKSVAESLRPRSVKVPPKALLFAHCRMAVESFLLPRKVGGRYQVLPYEGRI